MMLHNLQKASYICIFTRQIYYMTFFHLANLAIVHLHVQKYGQMVRFSTISLTRMHTHTNMKLNL